MAGSSLEDKFEIASEGKLRTIHTPFEHRNHGARIVIVEITPCRTQLPNAVLLPMGEKVDAVLAYLALEGVIPKSRIMRGMLRSYLVSNERIQHYL